MADIIAHVRTSEVMKVPRIGTKIEEHGGHIVSICFAPISFGLNYWHIFYRCADDETLDLITSEVSVF